LAQRSEIRPAAVLVPVVKRKHGLTSCSRAAPAPQRPRRQISFPGGRSEPGDKNAGKQRCARPQRRSCGARAGGGARGASQYVTVTGYRVTPVVGLVTPRSSCGWDEFEVAEVFEVPLEFLLDLRTTASATAFSTRGPSAVTTRAVWPVLHLGSHAGMLMTWFPFLTAESPAHRESKP